MSRSMPESAEQWTCPETETKVGFRFYSKFSEQRKRWVVCVWLTWGDSTGENAMAFCITITTLHSAYQLLTGKQLPDNQCQAGTEPSKWHPIFWKCLSINLHLWATVGYGHEASYTGRLMCGPFLPSPGADGKIAICKIHYLLYSLKLCCYIPWNPENGSLSPKTSTSANARWRCQCLMELSITQSFKALTYYQKQLKH